ncbi:MAG TPA: amino acid racemase [Caulobacteraceae bacterium]|nr:amino acid racemase [Caulobacteraceae bacterium]
MSKVVGVIGGMGPAATVEFMARVQTATPAKRDQDHLRLIVDCNPVVLDRNAAIAGAGPSPGPILAAMARGLELAGAEFLVMPCNAAHAFAGDIAAATDIPFVDLIETACAAALARGASRVGVLAADGCLQAGLYQRGLAERGAKTVVGSAQEQAEFMTLLYEIKAGARGGSPKERMRALAQGLVGAGADLILAGCTEIGLVLAPEDVEVPLIDTLDVLAQRTVAVALEPAASP